MMRDFRSFPVKAFLHGRHAATLEAHPSCPRQVTPGDALSWMSSTWTEETPAETVRSWLLCALPESGLLDAWKEDAAAALGGVGVPDQPRVPETLLWAHAGSEFGGALQTAREEDPVPARAARLNDHASLDEGQVVELLRAVARKARGRFAGHGWSKGLNPSSASLAGMRPKTSLSIDDDGAWRHGSLNTHVIKLEDFPDNPGEAGVESICQRTIMQLGLRAAAARSRMVGGMQCVLSERADRVVRDGVIAPVHQEDFRQASGCAQKFPARGAPEWPEAYALLRDLAADPDGECRELTGVLAAAWLLGHGDLHRGNLGFHVSCPDDGAKVASLAPASDVSSGMGSRYSENLCFPIGGQHLVREIRTGTWLGHAGRCGLDPGITIATVADVADRMADAFSDARREALDEDENREQADVDRRCDAIMEHIVRCTARFSQGLEASRFQALRDPVPGKSAADDDMDIGF